MSERKVTLSDLRAARTGVSWGSLGCLVVGAWVHAGFGAALVALGFWLLLLRTRPRWVRVLSRAPGTVHYVNLARVNAITVGPDGASIVTSPNFGVDARGALDEDVHLATIAWPLGREWS